MYVRPFVRPSVRPSVRPRRQTLSCAKNVESRWPGRGPFDAARAPVPNDAAPARAPAVTVDAALVDAASAWAPIRFDAARAPVLVYAAPARAPVPVTPAPA
jgi:hypothetical protein